MNITYVTALYNIYNDDTTSNRLLRDVKSLLEQRFKVILYVDEFYNKIIRSMNLYSNVTVIELSIDKIRTYSLLSEKKDNVELPNERSHKKDTFEYLALMNSKIEFLYLSLPILTTPYIAWIDAGISKLFKNKREAFLYLEELKIINTEKILIPGAYKKQLNFDNLTNNIFWVFLGSFFICHNKVVTEFYNLSTFTNFKFLFYNKLTWEVNIWVDILNNLPDIFEWYLADHNDNIIKVPEQFHSTG